jgi:hypothetical protein
VLKNFGLALVLMTIAGVASARDSDSNKCFHMRLNFCAPSKKHQPVKAPEIDPSSAIAGLTFMMGGLAVLRGRRKIKE